MHKLSAIIAAFNIKIEHIKYDACQKLEELRVEVNKSTPIQDRYLAEAIEKSRLGRLTGAAALFESMRAAQNNQYAQLVSQQEAAYNMGQSQAMRSFGPVHDPFTPLYPDPYGQRAICPRILPEDRQ